MPFFYKKSEKNNKKANPKTLCSVLLMWICVMTLWMSGCSFQKQKEVFWIEEQTVQSQDTEAAETVQTREEALELEKEQIQTDGPKKQALFVVHICGAVVNPGVYELAEGSRVMDAVKAAGGFTDIAASDACNLAEKIADASRIYIPSVSEMERMAAENRQDFEAFVWEQEKEQAAEQEHGQMLVNINTADADTLQTLPGIGESRAAAIIAYRQTVGAFSSIEEIMKVSGIKQSAFDKLKDRITV